MYKNLNYVKNNIGDKIVFIFLFIILIIYILCIINIKIEIIKNNKDNNYLILKYGIIKIRFNLDKIINKINDHKNNSLINLISDLKNMIYNKKKLIKFFNASKIDYCIINVNNNSSNEIYLEYLNATSTIILSLLNGYLENNFKRLNNYKTKITNNISIIESKIDIFYHLLLKFNIKDLFISFF